MSVYFVTLVLLHYPFPLYFCAFSFIIFFSLCPIYPWGRRKRQLSFIRMAFPIKRQPKSSPMTDGCPWRESPKSQRMSGGPSLQKFLKNLYESMLRRLAAVKAAGGCHTKYQSSAEQSNCIVLINKWTFTQGGSVMYYHFVYRVEDTNKDNIRSMVQA